MKFDDILVEIGEFGYYQRRMFLISSMVAVISGYQWMSVVFLMYIPDHRCAIPFFENDTYEVQSSYHADLINSTIPMVRRSQAATYSQCFVYNQTRAELSSQYNSSQVECSSWVYDSSVMDVTVISEFNMVCKNEIYRSFGTMLTFAGATIGTFCIGLMADLCGRKLAMLASVLLNMVASVVGAFSPSYVFFVAVQFCFGFTSAGLYMVPFVIAVEITGKSKRTLIGMVMNYFWVVGMLILTLVSYYIRHWRYLRLALGVPSALCVSYWWLIPESPRWLIAKGRHEEAKKIIRNIAKKNQVEITESLLKNVTTEESKDLGVLHLFSSPTLMARALIAFFNMFSVGLMYFGISLIMGNLSGDVFLNFFYACLMEIIAYGITMVLMFRVGRKPLLVTVMMIGGICCLASVFPVLYGNRSTGWILVAIAMIGRFSSAGGYSVAAIYITEIFPTSVRESAMAIASVFCNVGGMIAPYIADLGILVEGKLADALPFIVFGVFTVVVALLACFLPETRGKNLPETVGDIIHKRGTEVLIEKTKKNLDD